MGKLWGQLVTAPLFWARFGPHLIGKVDLREELPVHGDSILIDRYKVGRVQGQLWDRLREVSS